MGKRANPAVVGAFVIGAVVILVAAVTLFGSGRLFRTTYPYIVYFSGDVNGLNVGAPVKFKGVELGSVKRIMLNVSGENNDAERFLDPNDVRIPVIIELDAGSTLALGAPQPPNEERIRRLIELGLRAELSMESFVTGLLYVKLDIAPQSEARLVADPRVPYVEIPTKPTAFEEVQRKAAAFLARLDRLDVEGLIDSLAKTIQGIETLVNSPALAETVDSMPQLTKKLGEAIDEISATLAEVRRLGDGLGSKASSAVVSIEETSERAGAALEAARLTLHSVNRVLDPESPTIFQLNSSLQDLAHASRAVRFLAEELERNPAVLLRGKASAAPQ